LITLGCTSVGASTCCDGFTGTNGTTRPVDNAAASAATGRTLWIRSMDGWLMMFGLLVDGIVFLWSLYS
jgi:hypothetical protein